MATTVVRGMWYFHRPNGELVEPGLNGRLALGPDLTYSNDERVTMTIPGGALGGLTFVRSSDGKRMASVPISSVPQAGGTVSL